MSSINYWQVAAGSSGRDYKEAFLKFGMAFVGGEVQINTVSQVKAGDRILLKEGMKIVYAVGEVVERNGKVNGDARKEKDETKKWLRDFDGWDLPAYCFVRWHVVPEDKQQTSGLTRATNQLTHQPHLKELTEEVLSTIAPFEGVVAEPAPTEEVKDEAILFELINEGLRPEAAVELTKAFYRIRLLATYYFESECLNWSDIREHETRSFLILPLLLALGWAEQQLKIELPCGRGKIDLACFSRPYKRDKSAWSPNNKDCVLILESKGFNEGLSYAPEQARNYAQEFSSCRAVIVSNGYCYKVYRRDPSGEFSKTPYAYLNLLSPQNKYPIDPENVKGCIEVLKLLLPISYSQ